MRICLVSALAALLSLVPAASARADVQLAIQDGRVTLNATGATLREILAAWAKVGQTRFVNAERITGGPITLQLQDVTEEQALEVILRSVSGYLAAPRAATVTNLSRFDRIFVMPTSTPPRTTPAPTPPAFSQQPPNMPVPQPQFTMPVPQPQPANDDDADPAPNAVQPSRGPIFNTFPAPGAQPPVGVAPAGVRVATPPGPQVPAPGRAPVGVAVPGMIVEPPQPLPQREP